MAMRSKNAQDENLCDNCGCELNDSKRLLCLDCLAFLREFNRFPEEAQDIAAPPDSLE